MALRLSRPAPSLATLSALESALASFRISPSTISAPAKRYASHQAQGRANGAKDGPGKRLGAKKTGGQYVIPGNIIFKQRGTHWFPGDNCFMGRDHTIHAGAPGYVTYYKDPHRHPHRKFIGIVFERNQTLPQNPSAVRRRKLGMLAYQMPRNEETLSADLTIGVPATKGVAAESAIELREEPNDFKGVKIIKGKKGDTQEIKLHLRPGGQYREANWEIGRAAERSKAAQRVKPFQPGDRFAAWRKATARKAKNAERKALGRGSKGKKK